MTSKVRSRLSRCIRAPIRALCRAKDFYVKNLSGCADQVQFGAGVGVPLFPGVPRSYSLSSASERRAKSRDGMRDLVRAASIHRTPARRSGGCGSVTRSQSVAIGRIDEEETCEFEDDVVVGANLLFPRSRSCAVVAAGKTRRAGAGGDVIRRNL